MVFSNLSTRISLFRNVTAVCKQHSRYISTARIHVEPSSSIVVDPVVITGDGFNPKSPITIQASLKSTEEKIDFESYGQFMTNSSGCFDLREAESIGGTYTGVSDMGLFWSMMKKGKSYSRLQLTDASVLLNYEFKVFNGHITEEFVTAKSVDAVTIQRRYMSDNVERKPVKSGNIRGTLFTPPGTGPFPAIITLYGANKQKKVVEDAAAVLSNFGFVTLALAYFGVEDLPKNYSSQPQRIEYFEEAVHYLEDLNNVEENAIGVFGTSNGGSLALGMMANLPQIRAVAGVNACISSIASPTTYQDVRVEMLGSNLERVQLLDENLLNIVNVLSNPNDEPDSIHAFEHSKADLFLIVGLDDYNWKSSLYADIAKFKMNAVGKQNYEIVKYPGLGHLVDVPYTPPCVVDLNALVPTEFMVFYGGKDKMMHTIHQEELWRKMISFFKKSLQPEKSKL